jgi:hypothetical protein
MNTKKKLTNTKSSMQPSNSAPLSRPNQARLAQAVEALRQSGTPATSPQIVNWVLALFLEEVVSHVRKGHPIPALHDIEKAAKKINKAVSQAALMPAARN